MSAEFHCTIGMRREMLIDAQGIKRTVPLPFQLCLSRESAYQLREALNSMIGSEATYGWINVHASDLSGWSGKPLPWNQNFTTEKDR